MLMLRMLRLLRMLRVLVGVVLAQPLPFPPLPP
jgi:hypothetical protein